MISVKYVFLVICTSLSSAAFSQDKIYLEDDIRQGKITEVSAAYIKYIPTEKTSLILILPIEKVFILFNGKGDFLVPSGIDTSSQLAKESVRRFFAPDKNHSPKDQLFTLQKSRIEANIAKEDDHFIYLADTSKLDKKNVVAVIYRNGQPRIYGSVKTAASVMGEIQQALLNPVPPAPSVTSVPPAPATPAGNITGTPPPPGSQLPGQDSAAATFEKLAGNISKKEFEEKAENKTKQFTDYLKILCDKSSGLEELNKAINQAISLFVNENAVVETSSINNNNVSRLSIRSYLLKVKRIQYDKIEISWANVQYVSDLKPGPDGNFYGEVTFEQAFRGYRDGKLVYSDITRKNATVVLKTYKKSYEGSTRSVWDVLLSDIGVVATKSY